MNSFVSFAVISIASVEKIGIVVQLVFVWTIIDAYHVNQLYAELLKGILGWKM